jgi:hypothetical protein
MTDITDSTLHRLAELGLAHYEHPGWTLTPTGFELLPRLLSGDGPEFL